MNPSFANKKYWSQSWVRHIETYLAAPPRSGIWLRSVFNLNSKTVLELAGGSCRDSRYLFSKGVAADGSDFDSETLSYLGKRFKTSDFVMHCADAFSTRFDEKAFDISFHNGFWVCFDDNAAILDLLKEQVRITKKWVVILVHNKLNDELINLFAEKGKSDDLYNIRFFEPTELLTIAKNSDIGYKSIRLLKFGGTSDCIFSISRIIPYLELLIYWIVPKLYRFQSWSKTERIAMVIELG